MSLRPIQIRSEVQFNKKATFGDNTTIDQDKINTHTIVAEKEINSPVNIFPKKILGEQKLNFVSDIKNQVTYEANFALEEYATSYFIIIHENASVRRAMLNTQIFMHDIPPFQQSWLLYAGAWDKNNDNAATTMYPMLAQLDLYWEQDTMMCNIKLSKLTDESFSNITEYYITIYATGDQYVNY